MRKGFTLVEILVVIIVLPFVMVVLDGLFSTLIKDIPRTHRVVQENTTLIRMLDQMRKDIDKAKGLPESFGGHTASGELLLIELADSVICYQLKDDKVLRLRTRDEGRGSRDASIVNRQSSIVSQSWTVPHANVTWQVWRKGKSGYAVDVKTYIEHKVRGGHLQKKMANSHLYFIGAF